jgi:rRNA maturation endonuclease Nob1
MSLSHSQPHKVEALVVDTSPFIRHTELSNVALDLYTIPEVVGEIKDKNAREYFESVKLRSNITFKNPSDEAMREGICICRIKNYSIWPITSLSI